MENNWAMTEVLPHSRIVRARDQISTKIDGEVVVLAMDSEEYLGLDDAGARVWDIIQDPKTVKEILDTL